MRKSPHYRNLVTTKAQEGRHNPKPRVAPFKGLPQKLHYLSFGFRQSGLRSDLPIARAELDFIDCAGCANYKANLLRYT